MVLQSQPNIKLGSKSKDPQKEEWPKSKRFKFPLPPIIHVSNYFQLCQVKVRFKFSPQPSLSNSFDSQSFSHMQLPLCTMKEIYKFEFDKNRGTWVVFQNVQNRKFYQAKSAGEGEPEKNEFSFIKKNHLACSWFWEGVPDEHWEEEGGVLLVHLLEPVDSLSCPFDKLCNRI